MRCTSKLKKQQILLMKPEVKRLLDDSKRQFYCQLAAVGFQLNVNTIFQIDVINISLQLVDEHTVSLTQIGLNSMINDHTTRKHNDYRSKVAQFQQRLLQQNERIRGLQDEKQAYIDYAERMLQKSTTHAKVQLIYCFSLQL